MVWAMSGIHPVFSSTQYLVRSVCINAVTSGAVVATVTLLSMVQALLKDGNRIIFSMFFAILGRVYTLTVFVNFIHRNPRPSPNSLHVTEYVEGTTRQYRTLPLWSCRRLSTWTTPNQVAQVSLPRTVHAAWVPGERPPRGMPLPHPRCASCAALARHCLSQPQPRTSRIAAPHRSAPELTPSPAISARRAQAVHNTSCLTARIAYYMCIPENSVILKL